MAHLRDGGTPITVFSDNNATGQVNVVQIGHPRTTEPSLRIDTSSQLRPVSSPIPNPYTGFELTLQHHPLQDGPYWPQELQSSSHHYNYHSQNGTPNQQQQQDTQNHSPQNLSQQGQSDQRLQQTTNPPPRGFALPRHQSPRAQNFQQNHGPTWERIRRNGLFPPPVPPTSISHHPDHPMYPSYTFIQQSPVIVRDRNHHPPTPTTAVTGSSRTVSPQAQVAYGIGPRASLSLDSGRSLSFQSSSSLPEEPLSAKRRRHSPEVHETSSRSVSLHQQIVSKRQKRTHTPHDTAHAINPSTPTSNPAQSVAPFLRPSPLLSREPYSGWYGGHQMVQDSPMPPPPHPSANYFPFIQPVPASRKRGSPKTTTRLSAASPSWQANGINQEISRTQALGINPAPGASEAYQASNDTIETESPPHTSFRAKNFEIPHLNLSQKRTQTSDSISSYLTTPKASAFASQGPSVDGREDGYPRQRGGHENNGAFGLDKAISVNSSNQDNNDTSKPFQLRPASSPLVLPYGRAAPVVQLMNQSPFVGIIRGVVERARTQPVHQPEIQPTVIPSENDVFVDSFDSGVSLSHDSAIQPAIAPINRQPLLQTLHTEPPDASYLVSCVEKYSTHIQALYQIMTPQHLGRLVGSFLHRYDVLRQQPQVQQQHLGNFANHDPFQPCVELAIEYLVFALGSLCWTKWDNTISASGPSFVESATSILYQLSLCRKSASTTMDQTTHANRQMRNSHIRAYSDGSGPSSSNPTFAHSNPGDIRSMQQLPRPTDTPNSAASVLTPTLDLARAYLLAALLCGQLAHIHYAAGHVRNAGNIIRILLHQPGMSLLNYKQCSHVLSEEEQQLSALYWTCVQLEFEINAEAGELPSELLQYQGMIPMPNLDFLRFSQNTTDDTMMVDTEVLTSGASENSHVVIAGFNMQILLRKHLNSIYCAAYNGLGLQLQEQEHNVKTAISSLRHQFDDILLGRTTLPHTEDSARTARACSAYWEARSYGVLPKLLKPQSRVDMGEMQEIVFSITETIRAYHGLEANRLILPNAFGKEMLQCRYLLLLYAASRALPGLVAHLDDGTLAELIDRTLLSFGKLRVVQNIQEAARQVLRAMRSMLQPHGGHVNYSNHASQTRPGQCGTAMTATVTATATVSATTGGGGPVLHGPGSLPELSLYCPSFTTVPGIASGIPTASTMESFISFPTPNSPHLFPSSALTSPQHSPSVSATSSSSSPHSATFVSGSMPFRRRQMAALASVPGPGSTSPAAFLTLPPNSTQPHMLFSASPEYTTSNTPDFDGFVNHLGLSGPWAQG